MSIAKLGLMLGVFALGCSAATPGANPHDMSAANHEKAALAHQQTGDQHAAEYDRKAREEAERCARSPRNVAASQNTDACWTSVRNPTAVHARQAAEHRRHAADHRAASASLRDAEALSCKGIGATDRDMSPFVHGDDIASVAPLTEPGGNLKLPATEMKGAVVTFRAVPGMTAEWLQRLVDCHLARNSALGHVVPEMPDCPLVPKGVSATVSSTGDGFRVSIRAEDPAAAREVLARAKRLAPH